MNTISFFADYHQFIFKKMSGGKACPLFVFLSLPQPKIPTAPLRLGEQIFHAKAKARVGVAIKLY